MITVVSGLPRSGTSMMMQMLQNGGMEILTDNERTADDNNPWGYLEFEKVKSLKKDNSWIKDAEEKAIKVISQLLYFLPKEYDYRIIFMLRDLDEIINSQKKMIENLDSMPANAQMPDLELLKKTFTNQIDRVKIFIHNQPNMRAKFIDYKQAIAEPMNAAFEVFNLLGNNIDAPAMCKAVDPSLHRQKNV